MKAKEYMLRLEGYTQLNEGNIEDIMKICTKIVLDIVFESKDLIGKRKVSTNAGMANVLRELEDKFIAFNNLTEKKYGEKILNPKAFRLAMKHTMPIGLWCQTSALMNWEI